MSRSFICKCVRETWADSITWHKRLCKQNQYIFLWWQFYYALIPKNLLVLCFAVIFFFFFIKTTILLLVCIHNIQCAKKLDNKTYFWFFFFCLFHVIELHNLLKYLFCTCSMIFYCYHWLMNIVIDTY